MDTRGQYEEWFRAIIDGDGEKVGEGIDAQHLDVNARTNHGRTPLMLAARFGNADVVDALIRAGADVDATLDEFVLDDGAPDDAQDLEKMQAIVESVAAEIPPADTAGRRLARGMTGFLNALHNAGDSKHGKDDHTPRAKNAVFVEANEDDGFEPQELSTALCHAAAYGHTDVARRLVNVGADVDAPRWDCTPPLVHAAARGNLAMVGLLVGAGANPDDGFDLTALEAAAERGHADVINRLLQAGATADQMNENGRTPLMRAAENGHLAAVRVLIHGGADPNVWEQGETALLCAARSGHDDVVEYLEGIVCEEIREWVRIETREG